MRMSRRVLRARRVITRGVAAIPRGSSSLSHRAHFRTRFDRFAIVRSSFRCLPSCDRETARSQDRPASKTAALRGGRKNFRKILFAHVPRSEEFGKASYKVFVLRCKRFRNFQFSLCVKAFLRLRVFHSPFTSAV